MKNAQLGKHLAEWEIVKGDSSYGFGNKVVLLIKARTSAGAVSKARRVMRQKGLAARGAYTAVNHESGEWATFSLNTHKH